MQRFGRYLLLERIARGGMAEVYRAAAFGTAGFARQVAIKMLLPEYEEDPTFTSMLVEEAKIAAELQHPNVIKVVDLGEQAGRHFIVMDFITGQPASNIILAAARKQMRLPLPFCVYVAKQALEGLRYAHQKRDPMGFPMQIIHRDVSPQNVMVTYEGGVCLLDFGIAKAAASAARTRAGVLRGKTGYISPEVVRGAPVTQAMDFYALAVVMHEMIAMRRMRSPRNDGAAIEEAARGAFTKFEDLGLEVPAPLAQTVYRALASEADERFPDAAAFSNALDEVMRALGWSWGAQQTTELLHMVFPDEIRAEQDATARFHPLIREAARAESASLAPAVPAPAPAPSLPSPAASADIALGVSAPALPPTPLVTQDAPVPSPAAPLPAAPPASPVAPTLVPTALPGPALPPPPAAFAGASFTPQAAEPSLPPAEAPPAPASAPPQAPTSGSESAATGARGPAPGAPADGGFAPMTTQAFFEQAPRDDSMDATPLPRDRPWLIPAVGVLAAALVGALLAVFSGGSKEADVPTPPTPAPPTAQAPPPAAPAPVPPPAVAVEPAAPAPAPAPPAPSPVAAAKPKGATLTITTGAPARVWVDGKDTGLTTPVQKLEVPAGSHKLKLVSVKTRKATVVAVKVTAGQQLSIQKKIR